MCPDPLGSPGHLYQKGNMGRFFYLGIKAVTTSGTRALTWQTTTTWLHVAASSLFRRCSTKVYQGSALNTIASFYIVSSKTDCKFKISAKNYIWQHRAKIIFDEILRFYEQCWILKVISSKTHRNEAFQTLGVLTNDSSQPKAAWSIFQSLF